MRTAKIKRLRQNLKRRFEMKQKETMRTEDENVTERTEMRRMQ